MHSPNAKKLTVNVLFYLNHIRDYFCKNIFVYDNKCQYNKTSHFTHAGEISEMLAENWKQKLHSFHAKNMH